MPLSYNFVSWYRAIRQLITCILLILKFSSPKYPLTYVADLFIGTGILPSCAILYISPSMLTDICDIELMYCPIPLIHVSLKKTMLWTMTSCLTRRQGQVVYDGPSLWEPPRILSDQWTWLHDPWGQIVNIFKSHHISLTFKQAEKQDTM